MSGAPTDRPFRIYIPEETKAKAKKLFSDALKLYLEWSKKKKFKPGKRKSFSKATKKQTLMMQGNICNSCKKPSKLWDFHHKDGNRSNNVSSNCEALCLDCHAEKTRKR